MTSGDWNFGVYFHAKVLRDRLILSPLTDAKSGTRFRHQIPNLETPSDVHDITGCQTGCSTRNQFSWMFVCTMQPVVQLVEEWRSCCIVYTNIQPVKHSTGGRFDNELVSCERGSLSVFFKRLSNPFDNRFDNWLHRVYSRLSNRLYNLKILGLTTLETRRLRGDLT